MPKSTLGIASTSYMGVWRPKDTLEFLERCHALGASGIQAGLHGDIAGEAETRADIAKIRSRAERLEMYIEAMVPLPNGDDTTAFEQSLKDAQTAGAVALRAACLGTRRYESFASPAEWQAHVAKSYRSIAAALPLLEHYKIPMGLENHKDWTLDEMLTLLRNHQSEYLGVCLDFGNNLALLDDPVETIERLAPYTVTTHLKNMGVEVTTDGFLLSEVSLGEGYLDLAELTKIVKQARPQARFVLEMITRDPLPVPCLTDRYWASFPDRNGAYLARTLRFVQENMSMRSLPRISCLSYEEQLRVEEQNVATCMRYAREHLDL
ncbi:MAG TPA: TIM barrel protein [Bryobacteraceae bacterium]|nr:TIM barrel protein [Bryobacteraceae bacterium]